VGANTISYVSRVYPIPAAGLVGLLKALYRKNLLTPEDENVLFGKRDMPIFNQNLAIAIHRFGARTQSLMFAVQMEMYCCRLDTEPLGTTEENPNWRIRLEVPSRQS